MLGAEIKKRCDCEGDMVCDAVGDVSEVTFLGQRLIYGKSGVEWQGDCKIVQAFLKRAGVTPSARPRAWAVWTHLV